MLRRRRELVLLCKDTWAADGATKALRSKVVPLAFFCNQSIVWALGALAPKLSTSSRTCSDTKALFCRFPCIKCGLLFPPSSPHVQCERPSPHEQKKQAIPRRGSYACLLCSTPQINQAFLITNILVIKGLFSFAVPAPAPEPSSFFSAPAASSSSSPIFHARTNHKKTAAPIYIHPVNMMAPVYEPPLNLTISRPMASETTHHH